METAKPVEELAPSARRDPFHYEPHVHLPERNGFWSRIWLSIRFLFETEVHVYSFAVAANILISFFPFLVAMILLCRSAFHWQAAVDVILQTVNEYFPPGFGVDFKGYLLGAASHKFSWLSVFLLLFTANGIFVPLEVAFNRIWRVEQNRSFLRNQIVSLGLIFLCGALVLASISVTTLNVQFLVARFGSSPVSATLQSVALKLSALPITMLMILLVYWILPNTRIPVRCLIPSSIAVAVLLQISEYLNILTWPWLRLKLRTEVPPFVQSISIILWSFVATMIILAGAQWSARGSLQKSDDTRSSELEPEGPAAVPSAGSVLDNRNPVDANLGR